MKGSQTIAPLNWRLDIGHKGGLRGPALTIH
jgi:hypothetical protein